MIRSIGSVVLSSALALVLLFATATAVYPVSEANCAPLVEMDEANFSNATRIDHPMLPMRPGMQLVLEGRADRGRGSLPHRVVFTVTDLTKTIAGVRTLVIWDRDINEGELVEAELAFFAQDDEGNVWNLGEYPEEYEDGEFVGAPSTWIAEVDGADGGIHMPADPQLGGSYYLQGSAPEIEFLDCAKVFKIGEKVCVPAGCYGGVLVTDEVSPLDHEGGSQRKYHAPGVGIVQVGSVGDKEGETLVLLEARRLSAEGLRAARRAAMRLERRAYDIAEAYADTAPMERLGS